MVKIQNQLEKPIFIVGCMRSGTTLLAEVLGTHPNIIYCGFELKEVWSKAGNVPMSSPKTRDTTCPSLDGNHIRPGQLEQLTHAFQEQMDIVSQREDKPRDGVFLNKNPHLCNKMPFVNGLFSDSRFIWIYRDLPSVTASMKMLFDFFVHYWPLKENSHSARCWIYHPFEELPEGIDASRVFPGGDVKYFAEYWYENNKAVSDFLKTIPNERLSIIKEEDFVTNPRKTINECFQFLELPKHDLSEVIKTIDNKRNSLWSERLTHDELQSLYNFVLEKGTVA